MIRVEVANQQDEHAIDKRSLAAAARQVLRGEGIGDADVGIAVVDAAIMRRLNREYLHHDWPTDVLSFALDHGNNWLTGEIVVCAAVAAETAQKYQWRPADELLLYVIHGALHLVGYDDQTPARRSRMRSRERFYLSLSGLTPRYNDTRRRQRRLAPSRRRRRAKR